MGIRGDITSCYKTTLLRAAGEHLEKERANDMEWAWGVLGREGKVGY